LHILADKPYVVRSGSESYFSKSLLLSLDVLTHEQLCYPLTIAVSSGDKTIVFCSIYNPVTYRAVGVSWDGHKEIDWQALGKKVSYKINNIQNTNQDVSSSEHRAGFIAQTDTYLSQLNWSPEQGREFLQQKYGKRSRYQLSETELLDFIDHLKLKLTYS
jgi:hypothetical protein